MLSQSSNWKTISKQKENAVSDKEIGSTANNQQSIVGRPPYPKNYKTPIFVCYDGRKGNTIEHVSKFLNTMGQHAGNEELCQREFSKSLMDQAYTWYTRLPPGSIRTWDEMADGFCSKFFQEEERITFVSLYNNTKQNVNEGVVEIIRRFMDTALDCYDNNEEHELVEACINNMLWEYRLHLENLNIVQFVDLLQKAQRTALTVSERR